MSRTDKTHTHTTGWIGYKTRKGSHGKQGNTKTNKNNNNNINSANNNNMQSILSHSVLLKTETNKNCTQFLHEAKLKQVDEPHTKKNNINAPVQKQSGSGVFIILSRCFSYVLLVFNSIDMYRIYCTHQDDKFVIVSSYSLYILGILNFCFCWKTEWSVIRLKCCTPNTQYN